MLMKKFCPNCGGDDIEPVGGGVMGIFMCKDCGYSGAIFPEKPLMISEGEDTELDIDLGVHPESEYEIKPGKRITRNMGKKKGQKK